VLLAAFLWGAAPVAAQIPTLADQPGYEKYQALNELRTAMGALGRITAVEWSSDGSRVDFTRAGQKISFHLETHQTTTQEPASDSPQPSEAGLSSAAGRRPPAGQGRNRGAGEGDRRGADSIPVAPVGRAAQRAWAVSPDYRWKALYHENNLYLEAIEPGSDVKTAPPAPHARAITQDGNDKVRYGTCCWVYGEELDQADAMWWSPDSRTLAFYRVGESHMTDYHLSVNNTALYPTIETTRYPKAGDPNPHVALMLYDLDSETLREITVEGPVDQYLFKVEFTPSGSHLKFHRTNRWQNELDVMLADVKTGEVTTLVREQQTTWQKNSPLLRYLQDGHRFIWETERSGFKAFELRDLTGQRLNSLTPPTDYPCGQILHLDEGQGWLYYEAFPGPNPYHAQVFRVRLDGSQVEQLTQGDLHHTHCSVSPDHRHLLVVGESPADLPQIRVHDLQQGSVGHVQPTPPSVIQQVAEMGWTAPELFQFTANDGQTPLWGVLYKPTGFDPQKRYPLLIDVYGGPSSGAFNNRFGIGNPACEFGFLIAKVGNRGTAGRGKAFETAGYQRLGDLDIQDQADAVRFLQSRPYVDGQRVGIYGHSYGGYMSALAMLKFPDVFQAAVSGAPVTDWKNYDTIYTERYMRTPQENPTGYAQGSCIDLAKNLKGRLLLVHGLMDDNVHPGNTWQLVDALHKAGKRFDLQIYPGFRHGIASTYNQLRWEYFCRHLLQEPPVAP
jgi:dipeptidyl-peptidase-4